MSTPFVGSSFQYLRDGRLLGRQISRCDLLLAIEIVLETTLQAFAGGCGLSALSLRGVCLSVCLSVLERAHCRPSSSNSSMRDGIVEKFAILIFSPGVTSIILMMFGNEAGLFEFRPWSNVRDDHARELHDTRQPTPILIDLADTKLKSHPQIKATEYNRATLSQARGSNLRTADLQPASSSCQARPIIVCAFTTRGMLVVARESEPQPRAIRIDK